MDTNSSGKSITPKSLVYFLRDLQAREADVDISVENTERQGMIHVRGGVTLAAVADLLHGNGAILSLAALANPELVVTESDSPVQKTISLTLSQIQKIVSGQKQAATPVTSRQEQQLLSQAELLFFQFHHKLASQKLITILKSNRFYYPAWLLQSRIITRQDYIGKAIDEAYRWGNHDQEIWREARKIRPQIDGSETARKKCFFCWSLLDQPGACPHCHAYLVITSQPQSSLLKVEELRQAVEKYEKAFEGEPSNARIAYTLAVGFFNLKDYQQALKFMRIARKISPRIGLYAKSLTLLTTVAKTQTEKSVPITRTSLAEASRGNRILLVEDSKTSRKVLTMLFQRSGYEVYEAENGEQALKCAMTARPDLIVLDVVLPDTTGHELLPQLRDIPHIAQLPVIMLTGKQTAEDKLLGLSAGVNEYMTKPFNPEKLLRLVTSYLPVSSKPPASPKKQTETRAPATLPEQEAPAADPPARKPPPPVEEITSETREESVTIDPGKKSVFVVEDSPTSRKVLKMILKRSSFNVIEAATGKEALTLAESIKPDLVLLDVMLPDMTGYDLLPELKKNPAFASKPFFILTGKKEPSDKMKGMLLGSDEYITKPFNPEKLLSLIGQYIKT